MKRNLILTGIVTTAVIIGAVNFISPENEAAETEVKELIEAAYIHGAFNELNPDAMANGFHKDFAIFSAKGEELSRYEIEDWVAGVQKRKESEKFDPKNNVWDHKFAIVDVTEYSAIAKVELSNDGKHVYTDYLSLLKFDTGWKIVAKVYTKHE
jgi:hypothetical protein